MHSLDLTFEAELEKSPAKGGWTYVVTDWTAERDGTREFPITDAIRTAIGKHVGDSITVVLTERIVALRRAGNPEWR